jgi:nicotinate-nucleotide adenylyltransferase
MAAAARSVGILGGTFDPVHNAHLAMARSALNHLSLDKILFIPTGTPGYRTPPVASAEDRVAMLELALDGEPRYEIDERELAPGASAYTADTLAALRNELGCDGTLHLLMGADQYAKLGQWHRPHDVARLARIAVFARPGANLDTQIQVVPMDPMPVAASDIRARVARGAPVSHLVPPSVANYISQHRLYS